MLSFHKINRQKLLKLSVVWFCLLFCSSQTFAQKIKTFDFKLLDEKDSTAFSKLEKLYLKDYTFTDSLQLIKKLNAFLSDVKKEGHGAASIDSIVSDSSHASIVFYLGHTFNWAQLKNGNIDKRFLEGSGYKTKNFQNHTFNIQEVENIKKKIIRNAERKGYPFASVRLDSIEFVNNGINAQLFLTKNALTRIDSVIIKGNATIAPVYIYNYMSIFPGDIYDESRLQKISNRLRELAFVREVRPSQVSFSEKTNRLYLFLENKKSSQFDGVIGVLPDEANPGKINLTGEVHLKLQNSFRHGEVIELNWKQLPPRSQDLKVHLLYPFLFNSPFGIDANLNIFKRDTIFIDIIRNLGVQYALSGNNYIKAFVNDKESNLQTTKGLENVTVLPPYADISTVSYGTTFHFERLDYRINPRKGFAFETTGSAGNRTIKKNSGINPIAYETLNLKSTTYHMELIVDGYLPLATKQVLNIGSRIARIDNPDLFTNELYRIGGLRSLRGFDEESIFASTFVIGKIEYRYQLEQNSFLFLFYNQAWYERKRKGSYTSDRPFGFGTGINFETSLGIMSVSYALGKQFDNPFYFKNGKIHFGIVNYF